MNLSARKLISAKVMGTDEEAGKVEDVLFDDNVWVERYFVVATGGFLQRKKVLLSPNSISNVNASEGIVYLDISAQALRDSPELDESVSISYQDELEHYRYFRWPFYWTGAGTFGVEGFPGPAPVPDVPPEEHIKRMRNSREGTESDVNPHLRSTKKVCGYRIHATNGVFGHIDDFLFDPAKSWKIETVLINPRNWWHSKPVAISPKEIQRISWENEEVLIRSPKEKIVGAPYVESKFSL